MTRLAVVHPVGLLGKELRERLGRVKELWSELVLVSSRAEEIGVLTEIGGRAAIVQSADEENLEGVDLAFFCGDFASNRVLLDALPAATRAVILSPDTPAEVGRTIVAGVNLDDKPSEQVIVSPHPAVVALSLILAPLRDLGIERAVATVLQPVSLYDEPGLDELFEQTRRILTFQQQTDSDLFGGQLAFNLMPGTAHTAPLREQFVRVLGPDPPIRIQLLQASLFHSFAISLFVELGAAPGVDHVRDALTSATSLELVDNPEHLGPIDVAGRDEILVGSVDTDDDGYWLWAVMDNLTRGGALNALAIAAVLLGQPLR